MAHSATESGALLNQHAGPAAAIPLRVRLRAHLAIMRLDHSIKNVFVLPGIAAALSLLRPRPALPSVTVLLAGTVAATLIACSNYVLNELLDAPFDRLHPQKCARPAACGRVAPHAAYAQWLLLMCAGLVLAASVNVRFALAAAGLWIMGCVYNMRPLRTKDVTYLDVLTESINNPLRMLLGWYMVTAISAPPVSLLAAYWMLGCFFMSLKRFSELRELGSPLRAAAYRLSFKRYSERALLGSANLYALMTMLLFGVFAVHYRMELLLSFPLLAVLMTMYFGLSFRRHSAVQHPEKLYRERALMSTALATSLLMLMLLHIDIPPLHRIFSTAPW